MLEKRVAVGKNHTMNLEICFLSIKGLWGQIHVTCYAWCFLVRSVTRARWHCWQIDATVASIFLEKYLFHEKMYIGVMDRMFSCIQNPNTCTNEILKTYFRPIHVKNIILKKVIRNHNFCIKHWNNNVSKYFTHM